MVRRRDSETRGRGFRLGTSPPCWPFPTQQRGLPHASIPAWAGRACGAAADSQKGKGGPSSWGWFLWERTAQGGCRAAGAAAQEVLAGTEGGSQGTDRLFCVLLEGAWSSLPPSPQPEAPDVDAVQPCKNTKLHSALLVSDSQGCEPPPCAALARSSPPLPGLPLCSRLPPQSLLLPPAPMPCPPSPPSPSSWGPDGSIQDSGFSQIFSRPLPLIAAVTPAKRLLWRGAPQG